MKMLIQITMEIISSTWSEKDSEDVKGQLCTAMFYKLIKYYVEVALIFLCFIDMDLADDSIRSSTFMKLLHKANTWNQLKVLVDLINMWPSSTFVKYVYTSFYRVCLEKSRQQ